MEFTLTINDTFVPRIVAAYGLTGTNAQKKAQMEAIIKAWIKERTLNNDSEVAAVAERVLRQAEVW
jgi:hypothetical protein